MFEKIEEMLFENIGRKIKAVACVCMLILSVGSLIAGLFLMMQEDGYPAIGLLVIIFGPVLSWVAALTTYGFGQLVENSDISVVQRDKTPVSSDVPPLGTAHNTENPQTATSKKSAFCVTDRDERRKAIALMKEEGLITEEEYRQKLEELDQ